VSVSVPAAPAVKVMVFFPLAVTPAVELVMVPPVMPQLYVMPEFAVTKAERPVAFGRVEAGAVMVGVAAAAITLTLALAAGLGSPAALTSLQPSARCPPPPTCK